MAKSPTNRLETYRAKRDFRVTPEPAGSTRRPAGREKGSPRALRFCVQKHVARTLHYDFRLEHAGVLLSWAVPKGPSLDPRDRRLAARTEDHPLDYGDFEGIIPEGYGAGIVMLWDEGTWHPENGDVAAAMEKGELKFRLEGVKLKGSWVLVRTRSRSESAEEWLLIKHRDQWAGEIDVVGFAPLSVKSFGDFGDILRREGLPAAWRRKLPVQGGESGRVLRDAIAAAAAAPVESTPAKDPSASPARRALAGQRKRASGATPTVARPALARPKVTNRDKVIYPATGFTKGQLIDYYARVAPLILPHLAGRAATLKRYPDGVDGKSFFQKRCPDHRPEWVKTATVVGESGEAIDYCHIDTPEALAWVANLAAVELHVPLALAAAADVPTAMVFDLDPGPPAGLRECVAVARRIAGALRQLDLKMFAKFSGKKGVHLMVPLNTPDATFDQTRQFARAVAQALARDDPKRVTAVMRKDERGGRVFVDWSQNHRAKTNVCAWSLRAADRPAISWPFDLESPPAGPPTADAAALPAKDPFLPTLRLQQRLPGAASR